MLDAKTMAKFNKKDDINNTMATTLFPLLPIPSCDVRPSNRRRVETARIREKWLESRGTPIDAFGENSVSTFRRRLLPPSLMRRQLMDHRNARSATCIEWVRPVKPEVAKWKRQFEERFRNEVAKQTSIKRLTYTRVLAPTTPPKPELHHITGKNSCGTTIFYTASTTGPPESKRRYIVAPGWCSEQVSWKNFDNDRTLAEMHRHTFF